MKFLFLCIPLNKRFQMKEARLCMNIHWFFERKRTSFLFVTLRVCWGGGLKVFKSHLLLWWVDWNEQGQVSSNVSGKKSRTKRGESLPDCNLCIKMIDGHIIPPNQPTIGRHNEAQVQFTNLSGVNYFAWFLRPLWDKKLTNCFNFQFRAKNLDNNANVFFLRNA